MSRRVVFALLGLLVGRAARAEDTQVLPRGTLLLDVQYAHSRLDKRWGGAGQALPLIDPIVRYEPGGGYQGTLSARPVVSFDWLILQLFYGITDQLTVGAVLPIVLRTRIVTQLGWTPGDYMSNLGRAYSEDDFWQWAQSMGQPRPPSEWDGNRGALGDMLLAARWQFARRGVLESLGLSMAASLAIALPTGRDPDPEQLVTAGTNAWEVHAYGDVNPHLSVSKALWRDSSGFDRATAGLDLFYAWFRPRTFVTPVGTLNPLLLQYQPYVGDTYVIKGGDWFGGTLTVDAGLLLGPTFATRVSGGSLARARELPALLSVGGSYTYLATAQTWWRSDSALWDFEREKQWQPGDKNIFAATVTLSFLRMGVPLQLYGVWRSQEVVPGRYTRAADTVGGGIRVLTRFW